MILTMNKITRTSGLILKLPMNEMPCVLQVTQTRDIKKYFPFKPKSTLFCTLKLKAITMSELRRELHIFAKGSFFQEGKYDDNKLQFTGISMSMQIHILIIQQILTIQQNISVRLPPTHYVNPKFRIATQILPFFTEGKMKSGDYPEPIVLYSPNY